MSQYNIIIKGKIAYLGIVLLPLGLPLLPLLMPLLHHRPPAHLLNSNIHKFIIKIHSENVGFGS
jgi:hypothetical protein